MHMYIQNVDETIFILMSTGLLKWIRKT